MVMSRCMPLSSCLCSAARLHLCGLGLICTNRGKDLTGLITVELQLRHSTICWLSCACYLMAVRIVFSVHQQHAVGCRQGLSPASALPYAKRATLRKPLPSLCKAAGHYPVTSDQWPEQPAAHEASNRPNPASDPRTVQSAAQPHWQAPLQAFLKVAGIAAVAAAAIWIASSAMAGAAAPLAVSMPHTFSFSDWLGERMLYVLGKVSTLNVTLKVVLVLTSTAPAIFFFGALYSALTGTERQAGYLKMYALLNRLPGAAVLNEKTLPAAVLVNCVFFIGLFVFAVMLGVVTDEIKTTFKDIRNGKYPVNQSGHVVVLNWNQQAIPLLQQLAAARKAGSNPLYSKPVAVLANVPKAEMDKAISSRLKDANIEVYTRNGNPTVPGDLASVAAAEAASVIVLDPQSGNHDHSAATLLGLNSAQTALSLAAASPNLHSQNVVFQAPRSEGKALEQINAFKRLSQLDGKVQMIKYSEDAITTRMATVCAIQPGMNKVLMKLLEPSGVCWRSQPVPDQLVGSTFQHARRMFADGLLCGVMKDQKRMDLLVRESYKLQPTDQLILLSTAKEVPVNPLAEQVFLEADSKVHDRLDRRGHYKSKPRSVIVITMASAEVPNLVDVFAELAPHGSNITFVMPQGQKLPKAAVARKGKCTFKYLFPDLHNEATFGSVLKEAGIHNATAVVITGLEPALNPIDADAFVTASVLQVQDAAQASGRADAPHVVAQVVKSSTTKSINAYLDLLRKAAIAAGRSSAQIISNPDLFMSDSITASILANTAAHPHVYSHLVHDLLNDEDAELYFRSPAAFNLEIGDLHMWADVAETTRRFGETAVGVYHADGTCVLAPEPTYPFNFQEGDKIVVLAEEYDLSKMKRS